VIVLLLGAALAGAPAPEGPLGLAELAKLARRDLSKRDLARVEASLDAPEAEVRLVAAGLLFAHDRVRGQQALAAEWTVRDAAAKADGRVEWLGPAEVQAATVGAAAKVPPGLPEWLPYCVAFVAWRDRAAYVHTAAETINVPRLYRKGCADGMWARDQDRGRIAVVGVLDALDALAVPGPVPALVPGAAAQP
jgi:hypothetical protein